ncbi:unnamed protein product [Arctia plantaginis]|uniref:Uncharacterized protein n=1 Tax=Arctia plantaginis TaxID=874455 RepID=A0A8S1AE61_ARCPL|nr:unnamed protein product [Arctia plantaginis]
MPSISGISARLTCLNELPDIHILDTQDVLNSLQEKSSGMPEPQTRDAYYDYTTEGYNDDEIPAQICDPLKCHDIIDCMILKDELMMNDDPHSEYIINLVTTVSKINMTEISGTDWESIKGCISNACHGGYLSIINCMKGMTTIYGLQHSRMAHETIKKLGDIVDDLKITKGR